MTRILFLLLGAVCSAAPAGMVSGTVLDKMTQKPVRRVVVTLLTTEARPQEAVAWTDSEGRFAFGYLPEGRYRLTAYKMGYQFAAYGSDGSNRRGSVFALAAGENKTGLVLNMVRSSAITGTVVDEDGDPVAGAQVSIFRNTRQRGNPSLQPMNSGITDSHGQYRIANVFPGGELLLGVNTESEAVKGKPEVSVGEPPERFVFEQQFYPGVSDPKAATKLKVVSGQDLTGINFHLQALPMVTLRGRVIVPAGVDAGKGLQVSVMQNSVGRRLMRGGFAAAPEFAFQIPGLRPGSYTLVAHASTAGKEYRGVQQVQLGRENDISVALEPGIELSGTLKVEGPGAENAGVGTVELTPGEELPMGRPISAHVNKDGTFKLAGVYPGVWDINARPIPPGGFIKSMRLGDQDVLTEEMRIAAGTSAPLNIVVSTAGAIVEGTVEGGEAGMRYQVFLLPSGRFEHVDSFRRQVVTDENFHFEMKGITPGTYKLYAFTGSPAPGVPDLKEFDAGATAVEVKEGQKITEKLTLITAGGQNQ